MSMEMTRSGNGNKPHQDEKLTGSTGSSRARQAWANCGCGAKWAKMDSPRLKAEEIPISTQSPSNNIVVPTLDALVTYPSTAPPGQFRAHHIAPRGCGWVLLAFTTAQLFGLVAFSWPVSTPFTGYDLPLDPPFHRWSMEGRPKGAEDAE
ncbi:hypothetical protein BO83DRAFT_402894 [Aspergillus eucalypticola CBS 122712]|uniref:Uncharacterized protein n=1 Tax=Aspergillus eucalypticola (strain CBS 122712 / IBT 29274) TaxID=1448314 RepID=A0A317UP67_ASPEC|nr:uncharacterized protein BO83DRAFT_402894 [Aspergillus eucalypticola CBS 122712]PWY63783.1 hypothetical protein BO83DRAFT_402894 [Aspergillus eucalypticola CBS 122712]